MSGDLGKSTRRSRKRASALGNDRLHGIVDRGQVDDRLAPGRLPRHLVRVENDTAVDQVVMYNLLARSFERGDHRAPDDTAAPRDQ